MNRFMLTITVATAALLGAADSYAQTILYTPPTASAATAPTTAPVPLGQFIGGRITDKSASKFQQWLTASDIQGNFNPEKGYTVFAVVDKDFNPAQPEHPIEHYIVNDRVTPKIMQGKEDTVKAINGDSIKLSHTTGGSYYADGKRINGVIKNPEGTIFLIGGSVSAFHL